MPYEPALLARGPWRPDEVEVHWSDDHYDPPPAREEAADAAIAALRDRFGLEATMHEGLVTIAVESGGEFVPRLFADLDVPIKSVSVSRPSLDDVFMSYTGTTIRDAEATSSDRNRTFARMMAR